MFFGVMKATMGEPADVADRNELKLACASRRARPRVARKRQGPEDRHRRRRIESRRLAEILAVYRRVVGKAPAVAPLPGFAPRLMLPEDMYLMLRWFAEAGYTGDVAAVQREHPEALTFEAWLRQRLTPVQ
jgi:hypothetical protein